MSLKITTKSIISNLYQYIALSKHLTPRASLKRDHFITALVLAHISKKQKHKFPTCVIIINRDYFPSSSFNPTTTLKILTT